MCEKMFALSVVNGSCNQRAAGGRRLISAPLGSPSPERSDLIWAVGIEA